MLKHLLTDYKNTVNFKKTEIVKQVKNKLSKMQISIHTFLLQAEIRAIETYLNDLKKYFFFCKLHQLELSIKK